MNTIQYRSEQGVIHGLLLSEGRKYNHLVLIEHPVGVTKILKEEMRYVRNLSDYPVSKVLKVLHRMIKSDYGSLRAAPKAVKAIF